MINFIYERKGVNDKVDIAIGLFESVLRSEDFFTDMVKLNWFSHSKDSGLAVYHSLFSCEDSIRIVYYRPWYRWSKAVGYYANGVIHINDRKINKLTVNDLVELIAHETCHFLGYKHKGNYKYKYDNVHSVPYMVGRIMKENTL